MRKWLLGIAATIFGLSVMVACGEEEPSTPPASTTCTVTFDTCTDLQTNNIMAQEVAKGETLMKPIVVVTGANPNNAKVTGWYEDPEYTDEWNFLTDTVEKSMTLYAKWSNTYEITYYLGNEIETPMSTDKIEEGKPLKLMHDLADGYRSNGFFTSPDYTEEVVEGAPVTSDMNVYIHRSDEFYFDGKFIANRFTMEAAGGMGSKAGEIEYVEDGDYAKINYGYSTSLDPRAMLRYVTVDLTSSQKVKVTFKNLGGANALKFYFVARYEDEAPVDKQFFSEAAAVRYDYKPTEMNMSEDDEWVTITLDFAKETMFNGASLWGNAYDFTTLGIQSQYESKDENDLSNVLLIKSIEGVKDDTYVTTADSSAVQALKENDSAEDIKAAAGAQESVRGWIFPKDFGTITDNATTDNVTLYNKKEGLLFSTGFRETNAKVMLSAVKPEYVYDDQGNKVYDDEGNEIIANKEDLIDLNEYSTVKIRLRNFGYATTLRLQYKNHDGRMASYDFTINARDSQVTEYKINFYGADNYNGYLSTLTFIYESVGTDNAILIESVVFDEFEATQIPGFNFNDKNTDVLSNDGLEVGYVKEAKMTKFNVLESGASFEKDFDCFTNYGYAAMTMNYAMENAGVTNVNVALTIDGVVSSYDFAVTPEESSISLPLTDGGYISNVKVTFTGTGEIFIQDIRFSVDEDSAFDFSNSTLASIIKAKTWGDLVSFEAAVSATKYTYSEEKTTWKYYPSATDGDESMPLTGKAKMIIIYQNQGSVTSMNVGLGTVDMNKAGWKTAIVQPGDTGAAGYRILSGLKTNMKDGEWAHLEVNLSKYSGINANTALSSIIFQCYDSIFVRAVIFYNDPNQREVKFDLGENLGNAAEVTSQFIDLDGLVTKPSVAVNDNLGVIGWYKDADLTEEWNFAEDTVTDNVTLYAKWGNVYSVNYYVAGSAEPVLVDSVAEGGKLSLRSDVVADSYYKVLGYYTDADYTTAAVEGSEVTADTDIFVKVAVNFTAEDVANAFPVYPAGGGLDGSIVGESEYVEDGDYARINFGYAAKVGDPFMAYEGELLDISASQKLRMTFKYLGKANSVRFYFIVADKNGTPLVSNAYGETCSFTYTFGPLEKNMSEDDEWITKDFDLTTAAINGVSIWGQAQYLVKLRVQFSYLNTSPDDLSNEVLIKSIEGVEIENYDRNYGDTQAIKDLQVNDSAEDLEAAAGSQTAVDGWIFPKDNACVTESENVTLYHKTNGLLMSAAYGAKGAIFTLTPQDGKVIDLDELTTLNLRLKNLGYGTNLTITYTTANGSTDYVALIDARMSEFVTYSYNMFGKDNYEGTLVSLSLSFDSLGIDNAILIESISFEPFKAEELVGFNFNDRYAFGVENDETLTAIYDMDNLGTKFVVENGASFNKDITGFSMLGYKSMELSYTQADGVTAVKVALTINGATETYTYDVASGVTTLPLNASGDVANVAVSFVGAGEIVLNSITFGLDASVSFDFADEAALNALMAEWKNGAYDANSKSFKATNGDTRVYLGAQYAWGKGGEGSISLEGKSKIVVIYQNRGSVDKIDAGFGITSTLEDGWKGAIAETGTGGSKNYVVQTNMSEGEWAALEIDITNLNGVTAENAANWAVAMFRLTLADGMYLRAFSVI